MPMTPKRVSIAGLMGFVVVVAVGLVALKQADPTWASACFTIAVGTLTVGIFRAVFGRGRSRTFWTGFSLAGWLYLFWVFGVFSRADEVEPPPLLTRSGLARVQEILHPKATTSVLNTIFHFSFTNRGKPLVIDPFDETSFEQTGESLWALLIAWAGGLHAVRLVARREAREASAGPAVTPSSP